VIRKAMSKAPGDRYQTAEEMLVDVEQVMRLAFRPVGQTELQRWLADLSSKDGVPPLTREGAPEPVPTTVGPLRAGDGQESGLVLNLDDAVEVRSKHRPPPPPADATEVMTHPPHFVGTDRRWTERREVRIGGGVVIAVLVILLFKALSGGGHKPDAKPETPTVAATPEARPTPPPPPPVAQPAPPPALPAEPVAPAAAAPVADATSPSAAAPEPAAPPEKVAVAAPAPEAPPADKAEDDQPAEQPAEDSKPAAKPKKPQVPVVIKSDPDGTKVTTGKHVFGTTPLTVKLRPGSSYDFTFSKPGYVSLSRKFRFEGDDPQSLRVTLKKAAVDTHKPAATAPPPKPAAPPPPPPRKGGFFTR